MDFFLCCSDQISTVQGRLLLSVTPLLPQWLSPRVQPHRAGAGAGARARPQLARRTPRPVPGAKKGGGQGAAGHLPRPHPALRGGLPMGIDRAEPLPCLGNRRGGRGKPGHPPRGRMLTSHLIQPSGVQPDNPGVNLPETFLCHLPSSEAAFYPKG